VPERHYAQWAKGRRDRLNKLDIGSGTNEGLWGPRAADGNNAAISVVGTETARGCTCNFSVSDNASLEKSRNSLQPSGWRGTSFHASL
jgi:hypothetical protein